MSFRPTQTGLCKFRWVWSSLRSDTPSVVKRVLIVICDLKSTRKLQSHQIARLGALRRGPVGALDDRDKSNGGHSLHGQDAESLVKELSWIFLFFLGPLPSLGRDHCRKVPANSPQASAVSEVFPGARNCIPANSAKFRRKIKGQQE